MVNLCSSCGRMILFLDEEDIGFKSVLDQLHTKGKIEFNVHETQKVDYSVDASFLTKQFYIEDDDRESDASWNFREEHKIDYFIDYYKILERSHKCGPKKILSDKPRDTVSNYRTLTYECDFHDVFSLTKDITLYEKKYGPILLEKKASIKSYTCPICGCTHFIKLPLIEDNFGECYYSYQDASSIVAEQFKNNSKHTVDELLDKYEKQDKECVVNLSMSELSSAEICTFLQHLSKLESSIMLLTKHLYQLEYNLLYARKDSYLCKYAAFKKLEEEFDKKLSDNEKSRVAIQQEYTITETTPTKYGLTKPIMPKAVSAFIMKKPEEPSPIKPGLFNKKKVMAENETNMNNYLAQVREYETAKKEHEDKTQAYQIEIEAYRRENDVYQEACQQLYQKLNAELKAKEKQLDTERECIISERKEALSVCETNQEPYPYFVFMTEEVEKTKALLIKLLEARYTMHSSGIIHPKYFEVAAITTMCEYFEVGRVDSLIGGSGAYNLYESELRSNLIIAKLDTIIESLEQIKKNQFKLYTMLEKIEDDLQQLNSKLDDVNSSLGNVNNSLDVLSVKADSIIKNTAATAYYAEQTAKYTKINAELTNALGFMVALK